ncbi:uncharacterized protein Bfra_011481 [Botrytis fragariae]|uniref:Uncharacterized protein n=1 Tax=Botrytis fragariae TaxID=1964551 RepID=A0A8H6EKM5_9HELO|nr:uncharacterized protein Bfra_011481 [Botrytis fragariae]KAF5875718.1 hypothetical protein Bfra_011481 [Botrytis fragariae]
MDENIYGKTAELASNYQSCRHLSVTFSPLYHDNEQTLSINQSHGSSFLMQEFSSEYSYMLDFCLGLFCPGPGRRQKKERYINPASLALSRPRRRYPLPTPVYPLPAPIIPPPGQNYEQLRPISPIYYPEPELEFEPEPELFHPQAFQRVPFDSDLRRRLEPAAQRIHLVEPEPEVYLPLPRPRSPPRQHIHFVQQLSPPYIPSPPPSPTIHHIHVLPPPVVLPAPRQPSPPHTHIHLLGPAPPPRIVTPPAQTLALVPLPKVKRNMNFPDHPHQHPHPYHHHNHNHNHRHRSPSSSPSRSPSPHSHAHHPPHSHANNQQNNQSNLNNIPLADLIRDVLHRYLQINLSPGTAISIARLMSNSRNPSSNLSVQANAGTDRHRSRSRSQGRGRRGRHKNNYYNGAANGSALGSGRRGNGGNGQAAMITDSSSDSDNQPTQKSKPGLLEEIRRVNMCAQVANGIIRASMLNAEVHPKLDAKGRYPKYFQCPLKVRDFLAMDTKTLDTLLTTYDLPVATRHRSTDPAALAIFMAHLAHNQNTPKYGTRNLPCDCRICAPVHEDQKTAKREVLFEHLCVGALHGGSAVGNLSAHGHSQGNGQGQGQAQVQYHSTRGGGALIAGNAGVGGGRGGGGNQGANANANANVAGYLILPQPGHAIQVQNVQGAVPNRLNNNNIGLPQPSPHGSHLHHASQHLSGGNGNGSGNGGLLRPHT